MSETHTCWNCGDDCDCGAEAEEDCTFCALCQERAEPDEIEGDDKPVEVDT